MGANHGARQRRQDCSVAGAGSEWPLTADRVPHPAGITAETVLALPHKWLSTKRKGAKYNETLVFIR